jgi:hypothetical protein
MEGRVDSQAHRHPGVLCAADVPRGFNSFEKAYWMPPIGRMAPRESMRCWLAITTAETSASDGRAC